MQWLIERIKEILLVTEEDAWAVCCKLQQWFAPKWTGLSQQDVDDLIGVTADMMGGAV